jgi:hypothetical protein
MEPLDSARIIILSNSLIALVIVMTALYLFGREDIPAPKPVTRRLSLKDRWSAFIFCLSIYPPFYVAVLLFSLAGLLFLF